MSGVPRSRPRIKPKSVLIALCLAVALIAVGLGAFFAWDRWGRYDDHADMQGQWYVSGTTTPLSIDEQSIHLTDDVAYEYAIDDHAKTIRYTFGPMEGQGRYWFSDDRNFLVITDGEGFSGAATAFQDIAHAFDDLTSDTVTGTHLPEGDGVIVLCRQPGWLNAKAKEAAERGKQLVDQRKAQEKAEIEKAAAERRAAEEEAQAKQEQQAQEAAAEEDSVEYVYYEDEVDEADDASAGPEGASEGASEGDEGEQDEDAADEEGEDGQ